MTGPLSGKTAIVTGAAQGIGAAIAVAMAGAGARVVLGDRDAEQVERTAADIVADGGQATGLHHDVTDIAGWERLFRSGGRIDILVNNAGVLLMRSIADTTLDDFRRVSAVNTDGVFLGTKFAFAAMGERGGSILNISSIAGLEGAANHIAYCASKGAVRLMTKAAALEAATLGRPIRVNSIHPGGIDTPMTQSVYGLGRRAGVAQSIAARTPSGRVGTAHDIAAVAVFLSSAGADYINGAEIVVDGGLTAGRLSGRPA